ncbi:MAG: ABC transporter ATP-binding protein [Nitrososphaerales archaeon]
MVKKFSSRSRALQGTGAQRQLLKFLSLLTGSKQRDLVVLNHVNLEMNSGEIFGLLGPNGAGKTTLIKILSTLVLPDGGEVYVHGINVVKRPREALRMIQTALSNESGFEFRLTGRQNLEIFADLYEIPREQAAKRINDLLVLTGLEEVADRTYNRFSTGMMKKFQVCRVLLSDAPVLVFDEPTTGLDAGAAIEFRRMLKDVLVRERGKTVILASHNLWEVQQMCDRVAVLNKGKLIAEGTPLEIREAVSEKVRISFVLDGDLDVPRTTFLESIRRIEGITAVALTERAENGFSTLKVEGDLDFDYSALFAVLLSARLRIRSVETSSPSLEDAFIRLTTETKPQ